MKCINMSIFFVCLINNVIIILEITVALISYSLSNATSKAVENNGLVVLISPLLAVPWPEYG